MTDALAALDELSTYTGAAGQLLSTFTANAALGPAGGTLFGAAAAGLGTLSGVTGGTALALAVPLTVEAIVQSRRDRALLSRVRRAVGQASGIASSLAQRGLGGTAARGIGLISSGASDRTLQAILDAQRATPVPGAVPEAATRQDVLDALGPDALQLAQDAGVSFRDLQALSFGLRNPETIAARDRLLQALGAREQARFAALQASRRFIGSTRIPPPVRGAIPLVFTTTRRAA